MIGICSASEILLTMVGTTSCATCVLLTDVFGAFPSILVRSLNVSHPLSNSVVTGVVLMTRGEDRSVGR